ncbi:hypothetical protein PPYR_15383 [Photinus pyralis]|uniref:Lipid-binding serum glycoprotein N-terminal domain-containing protein n=2 Tax=Photinus pyralis TaxID=7054 RepID=A0A5N3ZYY6_PHOPY|nr:uncharacterized protein LOC116182412 [Photinus pyralis]KAB0790283.1 hypothetical protein PPYR_15383 [Photinus pyralis]
MNYSTHFLLLVHVAVAASYSNILSQLQVCKRSDPNLNGCLRTAIQAALPLLKNGVPEISFPSMNPIKIEMVYINAEPPMDFDQVYSNIELHGHADSVITDVSTRIDEKNVIMAIKGECNTGTLSMGLEYKDAIVFGFDLSGKGRMEQIHHDYHFLIYIEGELKPKAKHLSIRNVTVDVDLKDFSITVDLYGNQQLSKTVSKVFTDNSALLYGAVRKEVEEIYGAAYGNLVKRLFAKIPIDELLPK